MNNQPEPTLTLTLSDLKRLSAVIAIRRVAMAAGFDPGVFKSRIRRGTPELTQAEAARFLDVIRAAGLEPVARGEWDASDYDIHTAIDPVHLGSYTKTPMWRASAQSKRGNKVVTAWGQTEESARKNLIAKLKR